MMTRREALKAGLFGLVGVVAGISVKEPEVKVVEEIQVYGVSPCQIVHGVPGFDPPDRIDECSCDTPYGKKRCYGQRRACRNVYEINEGKA